MKRISAVAVVIYLLAAAAVYFGQSRLIYFPDDRPLASCSRPGGVTLWQQGGERGFLADFDQPRLMVFFHGNAESACSWRFLGLNHLASQGYDVLVLEYPGYRGDPRPPSRAGIEQAVQVAGDWAALETYKGVVAMGYSLGTGAASLYARDYPDDHVILFAPYDSIYNAAWARGFWFPRFLLHEDFDNMAVLKQVTARIDILHGASDRVIPPKRSTNLERISSGAGRIVRRVLKPGATHHGLFKPPEFDSYMRATLTH